VLTPFFNFLENEMIALMIDALKAQTELMNRLIGMVDVEIEIDVYEEDELEEGPLSEEEIAEWVVVPEGTDSDLVIDIVRQVEEIYGITDEEFDWEEAEEEFTEL
jgi:uncharacterized protein YqgV (UPF0045/DUF77 family)